MNLLLQELCRVLFPKALGVAFLEHLASLPEKDVVKYIPRITPLQYKLLITLYLRYLHDPS